LGGFFFVDLPDILWPIFFCFGGCYVRDMITFLSSSVADDALYLSG
jgi:hypothetical protein